MYRFLPWIAMTLVALAAALWRIGDHKRLRAALGFLGLSLVVWGTESVGSGLGLNVTAAQQVAKAHGVTPTQVGCAWILQAPGVTAPIGGARQSSSVYA